MMKQQIICEGERLLRSLNFFDERKPPNCNRDNNTIEDWLEYLGWRDDGMSKMILTYNKNKGYTKKSR